MRIALAKLLLGRPILLLLDEPTNHLDLEARNWLEEYLGAYPYAVILVSHDRYFLDAVVTRITDLTLRKLTDYVGNYTKYVEQRDAMLERLRQAKRRQDEESRARRDVHQPLPLPGDEGGAGAEPHQDAREGRADRGAAGAQAHPLHVPRRAEERPHGAGAEARAQGVRAATRKVVFEDVNLHIERGDRIALVGPNGAGKSTLMRMLSARKRPTPATRTEGHQVVMEYFAQDEATRLDPDAHRATRRSSRLAEHMVPAIRNILGGFLFSGDDVYKKAGVLSGGERTRLAVARMLLRPSNTLLLDEPTNHLDLDSKDVLLDALEDYGGTLIFVSHDRYFVEKLATKIIEVGHGEAAVYPGTYERVPVEQGARGAQRCTGCTRCRGARSRSAPARHDGTQRTRHPSTDST